MPAAPKPTGPACDTCLHYRRARPMTQDILAETGDGNTGAAQLALQLMQDERTRRDVELTALQNAFRQTAPEEEWPAQPAMSNFCGLREGEGIALFAEVKNLHGDCPDYRHTDRPPTRACTTCAHRVAPTGQQHDLAQMAELARLQSEAQTWSSHGNPQALTDFQMQVSARMSLEIGAVYYNRVLTQGPPRYVSYCAHHSAPQRYVPCVVQNRHDACPDWVYSDTAQG